MKKSDGLGLTRCARGTHQMESYSATLVRNLVLTLKRAYAWPSCEYFTDELSDLCLDENESNDLAKLVKNIWETEQKRKSNIWKFQKKL